MKNHEKSGSISQSAVCAGVSYKTASKYVKGGYPEEKAVRHWRTRKDPFEEIWDEVEKRLRTLKSEGVKTVHADKLFGEFLAVYPEQLNPGMLRSFQRRIKTWKAKNEDKARADIYFEQVHEPGRFMELDWFHSKELEVTINGKAWKHLICHTVLTYSNWEWAVPCESESYASLKEALQSSLFELGRLPLILKTDNSSTATHSLGKGMNRALNDRLQQLLDYYSMGYQKIGIGKPNQNGDVESANGHLRQYLIQCLILRGHGDFASLEEYRTWLNEKIRERNRGREKKFVVEKASMRKLVQTRLPDYESNICKVNKYGMVRIGKGSYSVPRQWHGYKDIQSRVFDRRVELWRSGKKLASFETNPNEGGARIYYQHLLPALMKKPGAFENYRYRQEFIPGDVWRSCLDVLQQQHTQRQADKEYLHVLGLTIEYPKSDVEKALYQCLSKNRITLDLVKSALGVLRKPEEHQCHVTDPNLREYDRLFSKQGGQQ